MMTILCFDTILIRRRSLTAFLRYLPLVLLSLALCAGCTEKKSPSPSPRPQPQLQGAVDWLTTHYRKTPLVNGWSVAGITPQDFQVQVTVAIPPEQSSSIMRRPADDQFRLVRDQVCPAPQEAIWRLLPPGSGIMVLPSVSGQVFIEVRCGQ
jgi:hypothetical protein